LTNANFNFVNENYSGSLYAGSTLVIGSLYSGSTWVTVGSPGFTASTVEFPLLVFAPDGTPYVAYDDEANGGKATVMNYNGSAWITVGLAQFSAGPTQCDSPAIAPDGQPDVAFRDEANGSSPGVMKFNGAAWRPATSRFSHSPAP
jgi:hypothetical protein